MWFYFLVFCEESSKKAFPEFEDITSVSVRSAVQITRLRNTENRNI
jgi:hypothetical protein